MALSDISNDWDGSVALRMLSTFYIKNLINNTLTPPTDHAGENGNNSNLDGPPTWRMTVSGTYTNDRISATLSSRIVSAGTFNNAWVECASGCAAATVAHPTINTNHIDGAAYFDLALAYKFMNEGTSSAEVFLNVRNLTNADPVPDPQGPSGIPFDTVTTNTSLYDTLGRVFRAGVRFRM
jgi:hypothetical protein